MARIHSTDDVTLYSLIKELNSFIKLSQYFEALEINRGNFSVYLNKQDFTKVSREKLIGLVLVAITQMGAKYSQMAKLLIN